VYLTAQFVLPFEGWLSPDLWNLGAVVFRRVTVIDGVDFAHCANLNQDLFLDCWCQCISKTRFPSFISALKRELHSSVKEYHNKAVLEKN
jgi:hypothetical protein